MASVGLTVNHDTFGTALAAQLSKAMLTDPSDAVAIERMKSALMTDALQRRQIQQATAHEAQETLKTSLANNLSIGANAARPGVVQTLADLAAISMGGGQAAPAAEAPVPVVMAGGGGSLPEHSVPTFDTGAAAPVVPAAPVRTAEPDWEYRVNQYPLLSTEPPVPVVDPTITGSTGDSTLGGGAWQDTLDALFRPLGATTGNPPPAVPTGGGTLQDTLSALFGPLGATTGRPPPVAAAEAPVIVGPENIGAAGQPVVGAGQPVVGAGQPVVGAGQPVVGAGQPVVGASQPAVSTFPDRPGTPLPQPGEFPGGATSVPATPDNFITMDDILKLFRSAPPEAPVPVADGAPGQPVVGTGYPVVGTGQPVVGAGQPVATADSILDLFRTATAPIVGPEERHLPIQPGDPQAALPGAVVPPLQLGGPQPPLPSGAAVVPPLTTAETAVPIPGDVRQPIPGVVEPPVPVGEAQPPIPVPEPQVIKLPGRPIETPAVDSGVTTSATPDSPPAASPIPSIDPALQAKPVPESTLTLKGSDGGASDTATTVQTTRGPLPRADVENALNYIMLSAANPEQGMDAARKFIGQLGVQLNPNVGPGKDLGQTTSAYTMMTGTVPGRDTVLGTDEAIRKDIAVAKATGDIKTTMIADRAYTLAKTPDGRTVATLVEGQPAAKKASRYGESAEGYMRTAISDLMVAKPDPKTWDATERQDWPIMIDALYGAKVHVAADGTVVVEEGKLPDGVLPGSAAFNPANPPPPTTAEAPADTQAAPAATTPATTAPAATAPAITAPAATTGGGGGKKNAAGRYLTEEGYPTYGGYQAPGEPTPAPDKQTVAGVTTYRQKPSENTNLPSDTADKQASYTRQALRPAQYFFNLKKGDVKITPLQSVVQNLAANTPVEAVVKSMNLSPDDREYYRNVIEMVRTMSHKDSGADVTKSDLETYRSLYELPINPQEKDIALLQRTIRDTLRSSREGFNGKILSSTLRAWDKEAGHLGIDLDKEDAIPAIGASDKTTTTTKAPPGFEVVNGKVVRTK